MARRKGLKSKLKVFRNIGIHEADYKRILEEDRTSRKGIAVIVGEALDEYFCQANNAAAYKGGTD